MTKSTQHSADEGSEPLVVVIEDDETASSLLCLALKNAGLRPQACYNADQAHRFLQEASRVSAMVIDLSLPDGNGIEVMRMGRKLHKDVPCFVLTAEQAVESAVQAMKAGAENYLIKPFQPATLVNDLKSAIRLYNATAGGGTESAPQVLDIDRWKAPKMRTAVESAREAATTTSSVFIAGGPATGKGHFAEMIHLSGKLRKSSFSRLDLAVLSAPQIEKELFGAALDGVSDLSLAARGRLEKSRGGTLYIENIDRLHTAAQVMLLEILEERRDAGRPASCRLITSSTQDVRGAVKEGNFSQDLWYALGVYEVEVPALAERVEDIPVLCEEIMTRLCVAQRRRRPTLTRPALEVLLDHSWPGNLSELHNALEHALTRSQDGLIAPDDFPPLRRSLEGVTKLDLPAGAARIEDMTKMSLIAALEACGGNRRRAAQRLGVSLRTVYNMINRYDLPTKSSGSGGS